MNTFTLTALSGSVDLLVELDESERESVSRTCQRAFDELIAAGSVPQGAEIVDLAASRDVAGMVRCAVNWVVLT